ncbi:MAG TPA: hypothetical protein VN704_02865, partial [Verrucomicrobiae bacterium]|nr:hypothetical protein [Verrucomicrobiae bacterium]
GWQDLGNGLLTIGEIALNDVHGIEYRDALGYSMYNYVQNIPNMNAYGIGHDVGFLSEKAAEIALTEKAMPILKSDLGLPRGLGDAQLHTNWFSYNLKGELGRTFWRIPTPIVGFNVMTSDRGLMLSRNVLTPLGYTTGFGQLQYIQKQ